MLQPALKAYRKTEHGKVPPTVAQDMCSVDKTSQALRPIQRWHSINPLGLGSLWAAPTEATAAVHGKFDSQDSALLQRAFSVEGLPPLACQAAAVVGPGPAG